MSPATALFTVIHPASLPFVEDWFAGVLRQTDRDFVLFIAVHGLDRSRLDTLLALENLQHVPVITSFHDTESPITLRNKALSELCSSFSNIICIDSDDIMQPERVAHDKQALEKHAAISSGLRLMDEEGKPLAAKFGNGFEELPIRTNRHGLTNTAFRSELLRELLPAPAQCVLMDWYFAAKAMCIRQPIAWHEAIHTDYRQYRANTARVVSPFTPEILRSGTRLVRDHLGLMLATSPVPVEVKEKFTAALETTERFDKAVANNPSLSRAYCNALDELKTNHVWWTFVDHPHLRSLWHDDA